MITTAIDHRMKDENWVLCAPGLLLAHLRFHLGSIHTTNSWTEGQNKDFMCARDQKLFSQSEY